MSVLGVKDSIEYYPIVKLGKFYTILPSYSCFREDFDKRVVHSVGFPFKALEFKFRSTYMEKGLKFCQYGVYNQQVLFKEYKRALPNGIFCPVDTTGYLGWEEAKNDKNTEYLIYRLSILGTNKAFRILPLLLCPKLEKAYDLSFLGEGLYPSEIARKNGKDIGELGCIVTGERDLEKFEPAWAPKPKKIDFIGKSFYCDCCSQAIKTKNGPKPTIWV